MSNSTWSWIGGTGAATIAANWTLVAGPGIGGFPQTGDAAIVSGGTGEVPQLLDATLNDNAVTLEGGAGVAFSNDTSVLSVSGLGLSSVINETGNGTLAIQGPFLSLGTIAVTGTNDSLAVAATPGAASVAWLAFLGPVVVDQGDNLTVTGGEISAGNFQVNGGSVDIASPVVSGLFGASIAAGGTLALNQTDPAATENITFDPDFNPATSELLKLEDPAGFNGVIEDFGPLDTIDLGPVSISTIIFAGSLNVGEIIAIGNGGGTVFTAFQTQLADTLTGFAQNGTFVLSGASGFAGDLHVTQGSGDTVLTGVGPTTWVWASGATGAFNSAADWTYGGGSGNGFGYPQPIGDTGIDAGGTIVMNLNVGHEFLEVGGTSSVAELKFANIVPFNFPGPTIAGLIDNAVPGNSTAETSVLLVAGDNSNYGSIIADGPAGSTFTIAIAGTTISGLFQPGYFSNFGTIQADAGNTLVINIGSSSAFFNTGTVVADGGTVIVNTNSAALAGGFMPVRGFYDIEGGGTVITADYFPASDGNNGTHQNYYFADSTSGNTLKIENIGSFGGVIIGFSAGDTIDLGTLVSVGTVAYSTTTSLLTLEGTNGATLATLVIGNGGTGIASGTFAVSGGSADGFNFSVGTDGDTVITTSMTPIEASGTSGAWQSANTWPNGSVPGSTAPVAIGVGATTPFAVNTGAVAVSVGGIGLYSALATLDVTSNITLTTGQISDYEGTVVVASGNTVVGGAIQLYTEQTAFTLAAGATLDLTGRLNQNLAPVNGVWSLQPGQNPYAFSVTGGTSEISGALLASPTPTTRGGGISIAYESDGSATIIVNPGATVTDTHTTIGSDPTSSGTLVVNGANYTDVIDNADTSNSRGNMTVGYEDVDLNLPTDVTQPPPEGPALLTIENNATVTDPRAFIAENAESAGTVTVSSGGVWNIGLASGGYLAAADGGQGALFVEAGGTVNAGNVGTFISNGTLSTGGGIGLGYTGGSGIISVSGAGALLTTQDGIAVGRGGQALMAIQNGGTVLDTNGGITVGAVAAPGANGTLVVGGAGTPAALNFSAASGTIPAAGGLTVGSSSTGTLVVADNGAINLNGTGFLTIGGNSGVFGDVIVGGATASAVINIGVESLTIGNSGTGVMTVSNLGTINENGSSGAGIEIGQNQGASGTLIVNGGQVIGSAASNGLNMGLSGGSGVLTIENGGTVSLAGGSVVLAQAGGAIDTANVQGAGSELLAGGSGGFTVGQSGNATLNVSGGGTVAVTTGGLVAAQSGGSGTIAVQGTGSELVVSGPSGMTVGNNGNATLSVTSGGLVSSANGLTIASFSGNGSVTVQGTGSRLQVTGPAGITVGNGGNASLNVNAGALVSDIGALVIGANGGGTGGFVAVNGGTLTAAELMVAESSSGALTITNGGTVDLTGNAVSAIATSGNNGTVTVSGSGSALQGQTLIVGESSQGTLYVQNGGSVGLAMLQIGNANTFFGQGTVAITGGGKVETDGLIVGRNSTLSVDSTSAIDLGASGNFVTGAINIENGFALTGNGLVASAVVDNGGIDTVGGGTLFIGGNITGTGSLYLDQASYLQLNQTLPGNLPIIFNPTGGEALVFNDPASVISNPISGLNVNARIEFGGVGSINNVQYNNGTVTVLTNTGSILLTDVSFAPGAPQSFYWSQDFNTGDWSISVVTPQANWQGGFGTNLGTSSNWSNSQLPNSEDQINFGPSNSGTLTGTAAGLQASFSGGPWVLDNVTLALAGSPGAPYQPFALGDQAASLTIDGGTVSGNGGADADASTGAAVTLEAGAHVSLEGFGVGDQSGNSGSLLVTGAGTTLQLSTAPVPGGDGGYLNVGGNGAGSVGQVTITNNATVTVADNVSVGDSTGSQGTLTVSAGGNLASADLYVDSDAAGGSGTVAVNGGTIAVNNGINVGGSGTGIMSVTNGTVTAQGFGVGTSFNGVNSGGSGTLTIGSGGVVSASLYGVSIGENATGTLIVNGGTFESTLGGAQVGYGGTGTLLVSNGLFMVNGVDAGYNGGNGLISIQAGGTVTDTWTYTFAGNGGTGTIDVNGAGAVLNSNALIFGQNNTGYGNVTGGAVVNAVSLSVGQFSTGSLTVGSGGIVKVSGTVGTWVGDQSGTSGSLTINAGGTVELTQPTGNNIEFAIGQTGSSGALAAARGTVTVTGAGALLTTDNNPLAVGENGGSGSLTVSQGGSVAVGAANYNVQNALIVGGYGNGSSGSVTVTGAGSELTENGYAVFGRAGAGTLTVSNQGTFLVQNALAGNNGGIGIGVGSTGNASNIGGSGTATVTSGGLLEVNSTSAGVFVGGDGVNGTLNVNGGGTVIAGATLVVGNAALISGTTYGATGTVNIGAGGTIMFTGTSESSNFAVSIGNDSGIAGPSSAATGTVNVSGAGALLNTNGSPLAVGLNANGNLNITQGGVVVAGTSNSSNFSAVAIGKTALGTLLVSDPGSSLTSTGFVYVGRSSTGTLVVENHGSVVVNEDPTGNANISIGDGNGSGGSTQTSIQAGGSGTAEVTTGGDLYSQTGIYVGVNGASGALTVNNGGTVEAGYRFGIGLSETLAAGGSFITNSGTTIAATAQLVTGQGTVTVGAGGLLKADGAGITGAGTADIVVGTSVGAAGAMTVTGTGATVNSSGYQIAVGQLGNGTLTVSQGGTVLAGTPFANDSALVIGTAAGVGGGVTVTDPGSMLNASGQITVGANGSGALTIENGATVTGTQLATATGAGSSATVTVAGAGSMLDISGGATFSAQTVLNMAGGTIDPTTISLAGGNRDGGTGLIEAGLGIASNATLYAANGTLTLSAPLVQAGSLGGGGVLEVDNGGDLQVLGAVDASQTVNFAGTGTLEIGDIRQFAAATITGFAPGDTIVVDGVGSLGQSFDSGTDQLVLTDQVGNQYTLQFTGALTAGSFTNSVVAGSVSASGAWASDVSGDYDDPTKWVGGAVPGANATAIIDFTDQPQVVHDSGSDAVASLRNIAGDFVMAGGVLTTSAIENDSAMSWSGGALVLNTGTGSVGTVVNTAGATLSIAALGQSLMPNGTGAGSLTNAGTISVAGGTGLAWIGVPLTANTGEVSVTQGALVFGAGGSSSGYDLSGGIGGTLTFAGGTFSVTGGEYAVDNTSIYGGETNNSGTFTATLDLSAASSIFFVNSLDLLSGGTLDLGAQNATAQNGFVLDPPDDSGGGVVTEGEINNAFTVSPAVLSGSGTLTVFGGGNLIGGTESGGGLTRLVGTSTIGASTEVDGGRTVENDGWMNWSSGNIILGAGDAGAVVQAGTLTNIANATFYVTADADIANQGTGVSVFNNAGVTAVFANAGVTDIDAQLNSTGALQVQSGTLSLNGGGTIALANNLFVAPNAVLAFGVPTSGGIGATVTIAAGQYAVGITAITGGTLDVAPASGAFFVSQLSITSGAVQFGSLSNAAVDGALVQSAGALTGSALLPVYGGAALTGGVESGGGTTQLFGTSVIGGAFAVDGGRTIQNSGWLNWSSGSIVLGLGDALAPIHGGTLTNSAGATFYITSDGDIVDGTAGVVNNVGVMAVFAGAGVTDIDATLNSTGGLQVQSGTLSLDGGGTITAGSNLFVGSNSVLQFGTVASGHGGAFSFTGGAYIVTNTAMQAGTVDLSGVAGVSFGSSLSLSGGTLLLGSNGASTENFTQSGGELSGGGYFYISNPAVLSGGLETGAGRTVLQDGGSLSGSVSFDGGYSVANDGVLTWSGGSLTLGGGDPAASTHAATVFNVGGAVFDIAGNGTIYGAGTGTFTNLGVIDKFGGLGTTAVYATFFNYGTVDVSSGTLALETGATGSGSFELDGGGRIDFAAAVSGGATMSFLHPGGTLQADTTGTFGATISGFAAGDTIDVTSVLNSLTPTYNFNNGTLTVGDGIHSAAFAMTGGYSNGSFSLASDGHGGTYVLHT